MAYVNARLPREMELNCTRREVEKGLIVNKADNGRVQTNNRHAQASFEYEISYPPQGWSADTITEVKTLFRVSRGGEYAFLFRDFDPTMSYWNDDIIHEGDGVTVAFQCRKIWTVGGMSAFHNVTKPVSPLTVKIDGVTVDPGDYTINYTTGVITFDTAPADGDFISLIGYFDILVRFIGAYEAEGLTHLLESGQNLKLEEDNDVSTVA